MFDKSCLSPQELASATGLLAVHDSLALRAWVHPHKVLFTLLDDQGKNSSRSATSSCWGGPTPSPASCRP